MNKKTFEHWWENVNKLATLKQTKISGLFLLQYASNLTLDMSTLINYFMESFSREIRPQNHH